MRRRLEQLVPWIVLAGFLATALVVNLLLTQARRSGVDALVASAEAEVSALADTQNARIVSTVAGARQLLQAMELDFEIGSSHDLEELTKLVDLAGALEAGLYLITPDGVISQGVGLDAGVMGSPFEWPGFTGLDLPAGIAVLPVAEGVATSEPVVPSILAVEDSSGQPIGGFVIEQVVSADSSFNQEIGVLERGETGEFVLLDSMGTVIASNDPSNVAQPVDDDRLLELSEGSHRIDGRLVVVADAPIPQWRVVFRQDSDEFEGELAAPLDSVGTVVIFVLLAAGFILTVLLYRRLRAARAEQERLEQLASAQQEFISIVSHELRTPVAGVLGFLETSIDHWDTMSDAERRSAVTRAAVNARRLQAMTRDVLDTQSIESGQLVHVLEPLDLAAEVRLAVEAAEELGPDHSFEVDIEAEPVWVRGDADRLHQVLSNLLENAHKNSPATEAIDVEVRTDASEAHVVVSDHGTGIDADSVERIFDKFVRGRSDGVSGSGLGLYISRRIINAHDGRIWAESEPGRGAVFHFVIPLTDAPEPGDSESDPEVVNT